MGEINMDDEYEPYQWQIGDPSDWGDSVGVPDFPYLGYMNGGNGEDDSDDSDYDESEELSDKAWMYRNNGDYKKALDCINQALQIQQNSVSNLNRKAIILDDMGNYEEALVYYDKALKFSPKNKTILANKADCMNSLLYWKRFPGKYTRDDLDFVNEALKIIPDSEDNAKLLQTKGKILDSLGEPVRARICFLLASKLFDDVKEIESQLKILENPNETFISIAGTKHYKSYAPFKKGVVMNLVREPDNKFDRDAIRVEINSETVGYVANSDYTLIDQVKSASQIKNTSSNKAEFLFVIASNYPIAKLL